MKKARMRKQSRYRSFDVLSERGFKALCDCGDPACFMCHPIIGMKWRS